MLGFFFRYFTKIFFIIDFIIINVLFLFGKLYFFDNIDERFFAIDYKAQLAILNFSWLVIVKLTKLYEKSTFKDSTLQFSALAQSLFLLLFLV